MQKVLFYSVLAAFAFTTSFSLCAADKYTTVFLSNGHVLELSVESLEPDEGYIILEITPDFMIKRIDIKEAFSIGPNIMLKNISTKSIYVRKLKKGNYYFSRMTMPNRLHFDLEKDYRFTVEPGVINYPGEFLIEATNRVWFSKLRLKNRLFKFSKEYGEYFKKHYPELKVKYTGMYKDVGAEDLEPCCE